ncbi:Uncharacterized protein DUF547 [hydrothermal vent metagenome]|uniref:Uncharacterized protein DUF547 n=1 Tax=hydrothermal vent metagenome TaxID=652676 RepID=A0A3B0U6E0_9ZZZZ
MKKILVGVLLGVIIVLGAPSYQTSAIAQEKKPQKVGVVNYSLWADVLEKYVDRNGLVNYMQLQLNRLKLDKFVEQVKEADISNLSAQEQKAFWINGYNALTVTLILDNYPLKFGGIRTINWGRPWDLPMRVAGRELTLGTIEHKILRPLGDPRVHFALNCASIGCPKLPQTPFYPENLDERLELEAKRFINDPDKVYFDQRKDILFYSDLLNWYEEDFLLVASSKLEYIMRYLDDDKKKLMNSNSLKLKKIKYDWALNKQ